MSLFSDVVILLVWSLLMGIFLFTVSFELTNSLINIIYFIQMVVFSFCIQMNFGLFLAVSVMQLENANIFLSQETVYVLFFEIKYLRMDVLCYS